MTRDVETVHEDDEVSAVLTRLARASFSGFPVVDDAGQVVGIVTEHDLVGVFQPHDRTLWIPVGFPPFLETVTYGIDISWDDLDIGVDMVQMAGRPVRDLMTSPVVSVDPETSIQEVIEILANEERDINRVPVIDSDDVLVGIVSRQDVLKAVRDSDRSL